MSLERRWHDISWRVLDVVLSEKGFERWRRAPEVTFECYVAQFDMTAKLAQVIHGLGHRAQPHDATGPMMYIPLAVQAACR